ncbi:TetR/AcrR family transcriptional regulator [Anaerosporobacter faecicola]|uniref:TetR/AcrR family transcriptional regulator n=1 Tax=Anaerosporobacter faecicola TaxID=2718714 RepID=UPI001439A078|nr:TetR/AcrR family transcriptional regulator [Anaerosporobacter faecicola]
MGKLDEKKKQKKDTLFTTAFDLFTSQGFNKTSISDIVQKAGVAKGTFYLYFKDKYDVKNKLIAYKASTLFSKAVRDLDETTLTDFSDIIIFLVDHIINQLITNPSLLRFIAKDLSWGIFKSALLSNDEHIETDFYDRYLTLAKECNITISNPEILLFMIIELVGSSCYNCILYNTPLTIKEYKPYLFQSIRSMIAAQVKPTLPV